MKADPNATAVAGGPQAVRREFDRKVQLVRPRPKLTLITTTAAALAAQDFPPVAFVVPGYVAEGLTVIAGRPKTGKSWLALGWAAAVASGGVAFGSIEVEAGDVLYLALEDNDRRLKRRLEQMMPDAAKPARLHLTTHCPRLGAGGIEAITEWCKGVKRPRLIVVDVFGKIRPDRREKENLYEADYRAIEPLKTLADELKLAVLVIHHTNKRDEPYDPFDAVSGTTGLTGAADTVLVLSRSSQGTTLYGRGRDIEEIETALSFDKITGLWTALGNASEVQRSDERSKLLHALRSSVAPIGPRELSAVTGLKDGNVRRLLGKMVANGEIEKAGYGCYRVSGTGNSRGNTSGD
ncbi:MAG: helicase RepA family protein [Pseudorhodoplanes sp.]|nr:helicase RepA family protein [Pseudorhodoplanes sp.]